MIKRHVIRLVFFLIVSPLRGEMIQGDGYSYFLTAPLGWVLDKSIAADAEADAVLYPQGSTYQNSESVLTVSGAFKGDGFKDLKDWIKKDEEEGRQQNPYFESRKGPYLHTRLQKSVSLFIYSGFKDGGCQAVGYLEEQDLIMIFILSSSNAGILNEDFPALQETVESYESMGAATQTP